MGFYGSSHSFGSSTTLTAGSAQDRLNLGYEAAAHLRPQFKKSEFETIVTRAKEYIRAGDIYQANLSQDFTFDYTGDDVELYARLRQTNPAPFAGFLRFGGRSLLSSSPELLLQSSGGRCLTRPIAGTRPRGRDEREDRALSRELLLSPKERAEHLMLLDLERNDLGRVAKFGTVRVEEQMVLEHYAKVIHIVSQVVAEMREDRDAFHLIEALFPGGTITGCPKIRSMEIIHELESKAREVYTGSLGFLSFSGTAVFNILIRTITLKEGTGSLRLGAGIVADSQSSREYEETLHKGRALFEALGLRDSSFSKCIRSAKNCPLKT
jgi:para-aminobenzoate synthetase component 1